MTATERIRAMLDERGVEYRTHGMTDRTWFDVDGISWFVIERENGSLTVNAMLLTPEQAIEATLGRGEVERLQDENERLRSCLSDSAENAKQIMHEAHVQEAENDKLRELVRQLRECTRHNVCAACEYADDACDFDYDMRELGIEVDA